MHVRGSVNMCENAWKNFKGEAWKNEINVADFIKENYKNNLKMY